MQQGRGGEGGCPGGAEPRGSGVFGTGAASLGTAKQANAAPSATAVQVVSAAGGPGQSRRAAADRAGNVHRVYTAAGTRAGGWRWTALSQQQRGTFP